MPILTFFYLVLGIILLAILLKFPEISFALFVTAGLFKGIPQLDKLFPEFFDLTVFFGAVVLLVILINILKSKLHIPRIPLKLFLPYLGLAGLMLLSLTYTLSPIYGADKFLKFITLTALVTFGPLFLFKNENILKRFFYTIIILSTAMSLTALISGDQSVFSSTYITFARLAGMSVLIILLYFITKNGLKKKLIWSVLLLLNLAGLLYSGGKMPIFALLFTITLILIFSFNFKKFSVRKSALLCFASIMLLVILSFVFIPQITQNTLARIKNLALETGGIKQRLEMASTAVKGLYLHPFLGVGVGGFSMLAWNRDTQWYPHNIFLETGSELGLFGLILLVLLVGLCLFHLLHLRKKYKSKRKYLLITMVLSLFVFTLFNTLGSGEINTARLFFVWIGTAYALNNILKLKRLQLLET